MHLFQASGNLLYLLFLSREDDDTLQVTFLEDVIDDLQLLRIVADIGTLADRSRATASSRIFDGIVAENMIR